MIAISHLTSVASGLLISRHDVQMSLLSGLPFVGFFALLLGSGYVLLAHRWPRRAPAAPKGRPADRRSPRRGS